MSAFAFMVIARESEPAFMFEVWETDSSDIGGGKYRTELLLSDEVYIFDSRREALELLIAMENLYIIECPGDSLSIDCILTRRRFAAL
jgi:hypothetical protein